MFNAGLRQGDALSAILFNLAFHKAIGRIEMVTSQVVLRKL